MRRVLVLAVLALVASACGRYLQAGAAVVNGVGISQDQLADRVAAAAPDEQGGAAVRPEVVREVLHAMIQEELARQEVERRGLEVTEAQVEREIEGIVGRFPSREAFDTALREEGLDLAELRRRVRARLLEERFREALTAEERIDEQEIRQRYERNIESFVEIRVRHILFAVEQGDEQARGEAEAVLTRIRRGASFAEMARRASDDPGSKEQGGDLGTVRRGRFVPEFERVAFSLRPGVVSDPVRSGVGYHLILVESKRTVPYREASEEIRDQIRQERGDAAFQRWLRAAVASADIEVNPRYGDWDPESVRIVPHRFFVPASPATDAVLPGSQPRQPAG